MHEPGRTCAVGERIRLDSSRAHVLNPPKPKPQDLWFRGGEHDEIAEPKELRGSVEIGSRKQANDWTGQQSLHMP